MFPDEFARKKCATLTRARVSRVHVDSRIACLRLLEERQVKLLALDTIVLRANRMGVIEAAQGARRGRALEARTLG
jgi:hypothetical protein